MKMLFNLSFPSALKLKTTKTLVKKSHCKISTIHCSE